MELKKNKIILFLIVFLLFSNCDSQKLSSGSNAQIESAFKKYLTAQKISYNLDKIADSTYDAHFTNFLKYERTQKLESNRYLKINKVYVHYRTPNSVEFIIYSDMETFCISTYDLDIDGKTLSFPENGVVKVLKPIQVEDYGDYEITANVIKTRKRHKTPYDISYDYLNGTIKNDTIYLTEHYVGKTDKKFKKKWMSKSDKEDYKQIYQPNLKARQYKIGEVLVSYEVTGEFNIEH